ncbi:hypothetical protein ABH922_003166 [Rhodococcus sp. 27YEA15]|uniref:Ig-like domain repeat protein n=1 Tax=Rhodococcus sp. 27YEA15 TaxID=3156259 RepID=UPI003C7AEC45
MHTRTRRRITASTIIAVLAGSTVLAAIPASAAPVSVPFDMTCLASPTPAVVKPLALTQGVELVVDAPETVTPGQIFDVTVGTGPIQVPDVSDQAKFKNVSRVKIDLQMPENAKLVEASVVPNSSFGLTGVTPNILRVNDNGNADPNGTILRLSGNNAVIGNGPDSNKKSEGGIVVAITGNQADGTPHPDGATEFLLPKIKLTLEAANSGDIGVKVRTAGAAARYGDDRNFLTFLATGSVPVFGTAWVPAQCSPRDDENAGLNSGADPLSTTRIVAPTTTTVVGAAAVKNGKAVTLSANVAPAANGGTVQFYNNDTELEAPATLTRGSASITTTFDEDGDQAITAVYSGTTGFTGSTSPVKIVTVTTAAPPDADTVTEVTGPQNAWVGKNSNLIAKVSPAGAGGTVTFAVDGIDSEPVAVGTDGIAIAPYEFATTGTHRVVARYSGGDGFAPSTALPFAVSVRTPAPDDVDTSTALSPIGEVTRNTAVALTAIVGPENSSGTVQFKVGDTEIGAPVPVVDGVAVLRTTFFNPGTFHVTAHFAGTPGFAPSTSTSQTVTVPGKPDGADTGSLDGLAGLGEIFGS